MFIGLLKQQKPWPCSMQLRHTYWWFYMQWKLSCGFTRVYSCLFQSRRSKVPLFQASIVFIHVPSQPKFLGDVRTQTHLDDGCNSGDSWAGRGPKRKRKNIVPNQRSFGVPAISFQRWFHPFYNSAWRGGWKKTRQTHFYFRPSIGVISYITPI